MRLSKSSRPREDGRRVACLCAWIGGAVWATNSDSEMESSASRIPLGIFLPYSSKNSRNEKINFCMKFTRPFRITALDCQPPRSAAGGLASLRRRNKQYSSKPSHVISLTDDPFVPIRYYSFRQRCLHQSGVFPGSGDPLVFSQTFFALHRTRPSLPPSWGWR